MGADAALQLCDAVWVSVYAGARFRRVRVSAAGRLSGGAGSGANRAFAGADADAASRMESARGRRSDHRPDRGGARGRSRLGPCHRSRALAIVFEVFQMAAQAVSLQAGLGYASTVDPTSGADSTVLLDDRAADRRPVVFRVRGGPASGQSVGREPAAVLRPSRSR